MSFLPLWWEDPPRDSYGGLITKDGRQYRRNIMRGYTESNARFRGNGHLDGWISYATKWVGEGGAIVSWIVSGSLSRVLDLHDDSRKRFILTYNVDLINSRMYRALQSIIVSVAEGSDESSAIKYVIAQAHNTTLPDGTKTVAVVSQVFSNPNAAILKIRTKLSGSPNVVTKSDLVYSLFRKDGLNG